MTYLSTSGPQAPLDLAGGDWVHGMRPPDFIDSGLTDAQVFHLPFFHELLLIADTSNDCTNIGVNIGVFLRV